METALIEITVQPKSSKSRITCTDSGIKVYLNSPPVDGKANEECIRLFSEALRIPKTKISVERGQKSKKKLIKIDNISVPKVFSLLFPDQPESLTHQFAD